MRDHRFCPSNLCQTSHGCLAISDRALNLFISFYLFLVYRSFFLIPDGWFQDFTCFFRDVSLFFKDVSTFCLDVSHPLVFFCCTPLFSLKMSLLGWLQTLLQVLVSDLTFRMSKGSSMHFLPPCRVSQAGAACSGPSPQGWATTDQREDLGPAQTTRC